MIYDHDVEELEEVIIEDEVDETDAGNQCQLIVVQ